MAALETTGEGLRSRSGRGQHASQHASVRTSHQRLICTRKICSWLQLCLCLLESIRSPYVPKISLNPSSNPAWRHHPGTEEIIGPGEVQDIKVRLPTEILTPSSPSSLFDALFQSRCDLRRRFNGRFPRLFTPTFNAEIGAVAAASNQTKVSLIEAFPVERLSLGAIMLPAAANTGLGM